MTILIDVGVVGIILIAAMTDIIMIIHGIGIIIDIDVTLIGGNKE